MKAHAIDPNLGANQRAEGIVGFVSRAYNSITKKGKIKGDKLSGMVRSIPNELPESMREAAEKNGSKLADISQLQIGENPKSFVVAKVLCTLEKPTDVPQTFLMVDGKSNFYVASVYHLAKGLHDLVKPGSELLIRNPHLVVI